MLQQKKKLKLVRRPTAGSKYTLDGDAYPMELLTFYGLYLMGKAKLHFDDEF